MQLTHLALVGAQVDNLEGLQHMIHLEHLDLSKRLEKKKFKIKTLISF